MKRFWKEVSLETEGERWSIRLDGRQVRTPAREPLTLPTLRLAEAVAEEWRSVEGEVDPRRMPLTGLANAAIDRVAPEREAFAAGLARYAEADLACYRADGPQELVARQEREWDGLLAWARRRYDVDFVTTSGLMHVAQPDSTIERVAHAVRMLDPFRLAGLSPLVTIGGSLIAALAIMEKAISSEKGWEIVSIDDRWQLEQWGRDEEATMMLESRRHDFLAGARFLELLD